MDNLGSEVGQKMRCAVKAKLIELGSGGGYIDDELPDYVMIMVANKRSKQQMIADLNLFLGENTELFVTWLHEVLQKLQEVTLPGVTSKEGKRKILTSEDKHKRDKKDHKKDKKHKKSDKCDERNTPPPTTATITDVFADHLLEKTKNTLPIDTSVVKKQEKSLTETEKSRSHSSKSSSENNTPNEFDIPTITEIEENSSENCNNTTKRQKDLAELAEIQKKIYQAKRQLKNFDELDESEDEDFLNLKEDMDELEDYESREPNQNSSASSSSINKKGSKSPVIFNKNDNQDGNDFKTKTIKDKRREPLLYMPPQRRNEREIDSIPSLPNRKQFEIKNSKAVDDYSREETLVKRKPVHERLGIKIQKTSSSTISVIKSSSSSNYGSKSPTRKLHSDKEPSPSSNIRRNNSDSVERSGRLVSRVIVAPHKSEASASEEDDDDKSLNSIIKIKPRPNVSPSRQACKNLLLKAVAEAQRSTIVNRTEVKQISRRQPKASSSPSGVNADHNRPNLYSKSFRERNRSDTKKDTRNIVVEVNSKYIANKRFLNDIEEEYVPEPSTTGCESDGNADYVYVPRTINNIYEDENYYDENYKEYDEFRDAVDTSKTQFVVTLNDENDEYSKKYSSNLNETRNNKIQQKSKEQKNKKALEKATNTKPIVEKPDRLQILAKKIKDKNSAERNSVVKEVAINKESKNNKDLKRKHPEDRRSYDEIDFEKSLTPPLEDFIEKDKTNIRKTPTSPLLIKRKRISLSPTLTSEKKRLSKKEDDITDEERENEKSKSKSLNEESRKVSTKKLEIVKKYEKIPELSAISIPKTNLKPKPKERCKFFPLCSNGDCEYFHPSAPCKSFPNCKYFADKCLYLHPKCKFDLACQRNDCNYTHSIVMSAPQAAPPLSSHVVPVQNYKTITASPLPTMCKYYPNCTNTNCTFYHPKLCRFGKNCLNKIECNFYHHDIPNARDKFKWVASNA